MKILIFFITSLFFAGILQSQVTTEWVKRYNGSGNGKDRANDIAVDNNGNVYVTGYSKGTVTDNDFATLKYGPDGNLIWTKIHNGSANSSDAGIRVAVDAAGNVYVSGVSVENSSGQDYCTIKYNSAGIQQWLTKYNGPSNGNELMYDMKIDGLGNVYVTGLSKGSGTGADFATVKYNTNGEQQWAARYNGPAGEDDVAKEICVDNLGNVYVAGYSTGNSFGKAFTTIKYNGRGGLEWVRRVNGPGTGFDGANYIAIDGDGNVCVTGITPGLAYGVYNDYLTIKYNSDGDYQWSARYSYSDQSFDTPASLVVDDSGNIFVTGSSGAQNGHSDIATIKYNPLGVQQWVMRYNEANSLPEAANSMAIDQSGNIYVTGINNTSRAFRNYATIKYNTGGELQWAKFYNGPFILSNDEATSIVVDVSENVYVTGQSGIGPNIDYATIKYSQQSDTPPVSTVINNTAVPEYFKLYNNYPNPFNPVTKIKFDIPVHGNTNSVSTKLIIYDVLGREVSMLINSQLVPGSYEIEFNASDCTSGIYFYRLQAGDFLETKKMILSK